MDSIYLTGWYCFVSLKCTLHVFCTEYALRSLISWMLLLWAGSKGISPACLGGHASTRYSAAYDADKLNSYTQGYVLSVSICQYTVIHFHVSSQDLHPH
jgi:hypothetical protein